MSAEGNRIIKRDLLEIPIPENGKPSNPDNPGKPNKPNEPPKTTRNLQIKLAGHVWKDDKSGKESLVNGIKDNNEGLII